MHLLSLRIERKICVEGKYLRGEKDEGLGKIRKTLLSVCVIKIHRVILYTPCIKWMAVYFSKCHVSSGPIVQDKDFYVHERINVVWWIVALWAEKYGGNSMETFLVLCQKYSCPFVHKGIRQINESSNARIWSADRSRWMLRSSAVAESCIFRLSGKGSWVFIT